MNTKEFGNLLQILRKEQRDGYTTRPWTQQDFAHAADIKLSSIINIENGRVSKVAPDHLVRLADALNLTSGERQEFLLAGSGINNEDMAVSKANPQDALNALFDKAKHVAQPAYIIDSFGDLLAMNPSMAALLAMREAGLCPSMLLKRPFSLNIMQFAFSKEAVRFYRPRMTGDTWDYFAYQNILVFRATTLQQRASPYFSQQLFPYLYTQLKDFRRYWDTLYTYEQDHSINTESYRWNHPVFGQIKFFPSTSVRVTTNGRLYLIVYVPADEHSAEAFSAMEQTAGNKLYRVEGNTWPDKAKLEQIRDQIEISPFIKNYQLSLPQP